MVVALSSGCSDKRDAPSSGVDAGRDGAMAADGAPADVPAIADDAPIATDAPIVSDAPMTADATCTRPTTDPSAINRDCEADMMCPPGYTCEDFIGFRLSYDCRIRCATDCQCPEHTSCQERRDKSGSWLECQPT